jgi:dihydroorotase
MDVWIRDGKFAALGGSHHADERINAAGMIVLPGAIDAHVHFRDPGMTHKEDWESGSTSAAAGGVTCVVDQPNTNPSPLDAKSYKLKLDIAMHSSVVDFCISGGPGNIPELASAGARAIGEIFMYDFSDMEIEQTIRNISSAGLLPTVHAEDGEIIGSCAKLVQKETDPAAYSKARPNAAEAKAIRTALSFGRRIHICHLSTKEGLDLIKARRLSEWKRTRIRSSGSRTNLGKGPQTQRIRPMSNAWKDETAKAAGIDGAYEAARADGGSATAADAMASGMNDVTCEVAPHHLFFDIRDYKKQGSFLKMNPPLRSPDNGAALWEGLRSGKIDILASDHAPHLPEEKKDEIWLAHSGVPGVETMLPLMLSAVKSNLISLKRVVDALSTRPAAIFQMEGKGGIEAGKDADLVIVDPRSSKRINADRLHSRADWTPYEGRTGIFPKTTIIRGTVVYDGEVEVRAGFGRNIWDVRPPR